MPTMAVTWPTQSKSAERRGVRDTHRSRQSAKRPTGRLMKKIIRQLTSVNKPPTAGPADDATAAPNDQSAMARARSRLLEYASRIRAREAGNITAAPAPCAMRDAMSTPKCGAKPHATDAAVKVARPIPNAVRAPILSDNAPAESKRAAKASV